MEQEPARVTQDPCRYSKTCHEPKRYGFPVTQHGDVLLMDQDEPKTYQEAIKGPDFEKWLKLSRIKKIAWLKLEYIH